MNGDYLSRDPRDVLQHLYQVAVKRALPSEVLPRYLPQPPKGRTVVIGAGKAAAAMAQAVDALWPHDAPMSGVVVTRYGHTPHTTTPGRIFVHEASHPVPDAAGIAASHAILTAVQNLTPDDLVLCLISGGGSALLSLPAEGLTLEDKQQINRALLLSGANIGEMNCVRKHLSAIKGGRLAAACQPARLVTLAISDVPGDDPAVIASGPTVPDPSTCADALAVLQRYNIPLSSLLKERLARQELETPKQGAACFENSSFELIATPWDSLQAAANTARAMGLNAYVLADDLEGESRELGRTHAALARQVARREQPFSKPCVILSGGETTVTVKPPSAGMARGRGGRAGEFCLGLAQGLQGVNGIWGLAADTDGIDGVEDNAGAFVTPDTLTRAAAANLSLQNHLDRNDAYGYFAKLGDLLVTGPTFTNVNDFRAVLVK